MKPILLAFLLAVNIVGAFFTVCDKIRAKRRKLRIREATLWLFSLSGAALGIFVSMLLVRHKTNHVSFMLLLPLIAAVQVVLIILIL